MYHTYVCNIFIFLNIHIYIYIQNYDCFMYIYMLQCLVAPPPRSFFGTTPLEHISFQERCLTAYVQELLSLDRARWEKKRQPPMST